jgi:hypothetical protein
MAKHTKIVKGHKGGGKKRHKKGGRKHKGMKR